MEPCLSDAAVYAAAATKIAGYVCIAVVAIYFWAFTK